ncbi:Thymidine kinase [compost metagenome]
MAKLSFIYSSMNAGKTTELLQFAHNHSERKMNVLLLTPSIDDRSGVGVIESRIGISKQALPFEKSDNLYAVVSSLNEANKIDCVLVDEAQFLTEQQVWQLSDVVDSLDIRVQCYGLRTDAFSNTFEGSERLLAIADRLIERETVCHCGESATMVLKYNEHGEVVSVGQQIDIGGNDKYVSVCRKHYKIALGINK